MSLKKFWHQTRKHFPLPKMQKIFFGALVVLGFFTGIFIAQVIVAFSDLKDIKSLENYSTYAVPTKVFDVHGQLITEFYEEKRELITYKDLPQDLIHAIISIEDNDFYQHHGFNPLSFVKGVILDPLTGKRARGASTLTQQLAKSLFTTGERSIFRKMVELWYTFQIEKKYSKEEILELYFNKVYLGHGCNGIQTAARFYFDKDAKDLTLEEASLFAGMVQLPESYSPILHPETTQKRHQMVLNSMVKLGYITREQADDAFEDFWGNYPANIKAKGVIAQRNDRNYGLYFSEYVRGLLLNKYGKEKLYTGGFQVYTTMDLEKQKIAEEELDKGLSNEQVNYDQETKVYSVKYREAYEDIIDLLSLTFGIDSIRIGSAKVKNRLEALVKNNEDILYLQSYLFGIDGVNKKIRARYLQGNLVQKRQDRIEGALISINPTNGYVEAMVGGSDFSYANQFNRVILAKRQMGSLFKAIYYSIAMDKKLITPASVYDDKPMVYQDAAGNLWAPRNYEGTFRGKIRVRQALQYSVNLVAIQIWDLMLRTAGYQNILTQMASVFGLDTEEARKRVQPQLAYALGVGTFSPYEVARAFSAIANDGVSIKPIAILKVKDRFGKVIDDFETARDLDKTSSSAVMSPSAAFLMQSILQDVLYHGTGASAATAAGFNLTAGGKTGTTPNWKDAWFAGFSKNLTTVVWMGFDDARKSLGRGRAAAVVAAPVWMNYMKQALKDAPNLPFNPSGDVVEVTVCARTGLLPTQFCPRVLPEYFIRSTVPTKRCDVHTKEGATDEEESDQIDVLTNHNINFDEFQLEKAPEKSDKKDDSPEQMPVEEGNLNIKSGIE